MEDGAVVIGAERLLEGARSLHLCIKALKRPSTLTTTSPSSHTTPHHTC